jgi:hypothetical protein
MRKVALAFSLASLMAIGSIASAFAQGTISFRELSASARPVNGGTELSFVAVLNLNVFPITFNYRWERSDGARAEQRVIKVNASSNGTYKLVEKWKVGDGVDVNGLWERVSVNSGNTHLVSEPIRVGAVIGGQDMNGGSDEPAPAPPPPPAAFISAPGAHPAYLHALSDLRMARALLSGWSSPFISQQMQDAVSEIERAIRDISEAAISDGKNIDDHPPIDAGIDNRNRLVRAHEILNKAYADIDERETNKADMALRSRALGHISKARGDLSEARRIQKWL